MMNERGRQLAFRWPVRVALGPDDYFVSSANEDAWRMVTAPERWPAGKLVLTGPFGSGKTHLARLFQQQTGAEIRAAADLRPDMPLPENPHVVIEDADRLPLAAQEWLFHLHNRLAATGGRLLVTAVHPPARWPLTLPDLSSRMQAAAVVGISDPDDRLLGAVLRKLFQDRQLSPSEPTLAYLVTRMDRSFASAARIVAMMDRTALAGHRRISRGLAREVLDKIAPEDQ